MKNVDCDPACPSFALQLPDSEDILDLKSAAAGVLAAAGFLVRPVTGVVDLLRNAPRNKGNSSVLSKHETILDRFAKLVRQFLFGIAGSIGSLWQG